MSDARTIATVAALLGDESRAAMCLAMLDGRPWTVSELAAEASVCMATASEHVTRLGDGGLVSTQTQGRCRYVRLAGPHVAEVLEALGGFGDASPPRSLEAARRTRRLAAARTCYDHLAGRLGVAVHEALVERRLLQRRDGLRLTQQGRAWFEEVGVDVSAAARQRRTFLRECLDLTERRPHLAGGLAAALCTRLVEQDWVRRPDRTRALVVTPLGERALHDLLAITPDGLAGYA